MMEGTLAQNTTRSLHDIKRDAERTRAELADTVDQLRASVSGARDRLAPDALKAELSERARERVGQLMETARRNPAQTAAIGALVAWPTLAIARAIPLPIALIGAGLFLTGTSKGREITKGAADRASDFADEAGRRAHDLRDASSDAMGAVADRVAEAATRVAETAKSTAGDVAGKAEPAMDIARDTGADLAQAATRAASAVADNAADIGAHAAERGRAAIDAARASSQSLVDWAKDNPLLIGGLGLLAGGFLASALPATAAERTVAGAVGVGVRTGLKAAAAQGLANAAGAAVRAASTASQPAERARSEAGDAASAAAYGEGSTGRDDFAAKGV
jgi:hypothetical protein